jgi:hypothetical protein
MKTSSKFAALVAASVLALSSTAFAANMGSGAGNSSNLCAAGNQAPMGANCTP